MNEIKIKCPNCKDPMAVTPDDLSRDYMVCPRCEVESEIAVVKRAVKKELKELVKAYNEYLDNVEL